MRPKGEQTHGPHPEQLRYYGSETVPFPTADALSRNSRELGDLTANELQHEIALTWPDVLANVS